MSIILSIDSDILNENILKLVANDKHKFFINKRGIIASYWQFRQEKTVNSDHELEKFWVGT